MAALPELVRVAEVYKSLAQLYIVNGKSGWKKPPYKTGKLYNRVGSYNNASNMVFSNMVSPSTTNFKIPNQSFAVALDYALFIVSLLKKVILTEVELRWKQDLLQNLQLMTP